MPDARGLVVVDQIGPNAPIEAIARAIDAPSSSDNALGTTTHVALRDPYLRDQLVALRDGWEVRPAGRGLVGRIRTRLAWWLLGSELAQANRTHATLVRIVDSLVVHLDEERAARRRLEESIAHERNRT